MLPPLAGMTAKTERLFQVISLLGPRPLLGGAQPVRETNDKINRSACGVANAPSETEPKACGHFDAFTGESHIDAKRGITLHCESEAHPEAGLNL